jgi:hypothetical protein
VNTLGELAHKDFVFKWIGNPYAFQLIDELLYVFSANFIEIYSLKRLSLMTVVPLMGFGIVIRRMLCDEQKLMQITLLK